MLEMTVGCRMPRGARYSRLFQAEAKRRIRKNKQRRKMPKPVPYRSGTKENSPRVQISGKRRTTMYFDTTYPRMQPQRLLESREKQGFSSDSRIRIAHSFVFLVLPSIYSRPPVHINSFHSLDIRSKVEIR